MTCDEQLALWVQGQNVHNDERGECCPDFACCQPNNHMTPEQRLRFQKAYQEGDEATQWEFLTMTLGGAVQSLAPSLTVHLAGQPIDPTEH